jgi:hypothetical protein
MGALCLIGAAAGWLAAGFVFALLLGGVLDRGR